MGLDESRRFECHRGRHGRRTCDGVSLPRRTPAVGGARFVVRRPRVRVICLCHSGKAPSAVWGSRLPARCLARTPDAPRTRSPIACAPSMPCKVSGAGTHRACVRGRRVRVAQVGDVECRPGWLGQEKRWRFTLHELHRVPTVLMCSCDGSLTTPTLRIGTSNGDASLLHLAAGSRYCAAILLRSRTNVPRVWPYRDALR